MRKRIIDQGVQEVPETENCWLNLENMAQAELTSEDEVHPIELALVPGGGGWQAADAGQQVLRLLFDEPQRISHVRLVFREDHQERTQEFVLRWSADGDNYHDIARQQYNFSSPDSNRELEDYCVNLNGVTVLELSIIPDISGGDVRASLAEWRIA